MVVKLKGTSTFMANKAMFTHPKCGICASQDTYDIVMHNNTQVVVWYTRGTEHLCTKCFKINGVWDRFCWLFVKPIIRILRKGGGLCQKHG